MEQLILFQILVIFLPLFFKNSELQRQINLTTKNILMNPVYLMNKTSQNFINTPIATDSRSNRAKIQITHSQILDSQSYRNNHNQNALQTTSIRLNNQQQSQSVKKQAFKSMPSEENPSTYPNIHIYNLMKEQIDIAASNFRQKMNGVLKNQAQEIQRLSCIIVNNNTIINKQAQIIKKILGSQTSLRISRLDRSNHDIRDNPKTPSKSPNKISLTKKKVVNRPRQTSPIKDQQIDLQSKMELITRRMNQIQDKMIDISSKNKQALMKVISMEKIIGSNIFTKISKLQERLSFFLNENTNRIVNLQNNYNNYSKKGQQNYNRIQLLKQQIYEVRQGLMNLANRQFKYDSYPLHLLNEEISKLSKKIEQISNQNRISNNSQPKVQTSFVNGSQHMKATQKAQLKNLHHSHSLQYSQKIVQQERCNNDINDLNRSQMSSLTHYAPKYVKAVQQDRVKRSNQWDPQSDESGFSDDQQQDQFFYPDVSSQIHIQDETKIQRFYKIVVKETNKRLPVKVQIDQTGYIKFYSTGMYILDEKGDGFDLSSEEIEKLEISGVIIIV